MEALHKVFISYSRRDLEFARRLAEDLKKFGYEVWYDLTDLEGGDRWADEISTAIKNSEAFILIISPNSVASEWVEKEFIYASNLKKRIFPALYKPTELPLWLLNLQYLDFTKENYAASFQNLLSALEYPGDVSDKQPNLFQRIFGGQATTQDQAPTQEEYISTKQTYEEYLGESPHSSESEPIVEEIVSGPSEKVKADPAQVSQESQPGKEPRQLKCYVVPATGLRLRSGPNTSFSAITTLKMNAELTVLEDSDSALMTIQKIGGRKIEDVPDWNQFWIRVSDGVGNEGFVAAIFVSLTPTEIPPGYTPPVAGFISDRADQDYQDLLDISREVANIANVLTFKQVQPPLALGLFGDWGSGKTFFMGKLRKYINQIADHYQQEEKVSGEEAMWCSRVAQIEFNAWHFSDSNLWASLVTRIYEGLDRELNKEKETADDIKKKIIEAQIEEAKEKSIKAESQLDLAKTRVNDAEMNLQDKKKEREKQEDTLSEMIGYLPTLLEDSQFKNSLQSLQEATSALGVPEAAQTFEALEELDGQLKNLSGRLTAVTMSLLHSPKTLGLMAIFVVALPVVITFAIEHWGDILTDVGKRVAEISTFFVFVIGWLQTQASRGLSLVRKVEAGLQVARNQRQFKIENNEEVKNAKKALNDAQAEEQAARTNLAMAQTELQRLQNELQELRPERKLQRLIETRANSGAYAQHLGIISLIRSDFENMSRILSEMVDERRDLQKPPPIQRIILYIDDLDRCKPERVVEVLEAIHLLLFFPLFVVVVAVDPRWLRHSLLQHYPATLNKSGGKVFLDDSLGMAMYTTPQDYLEKIFQIPFALRPVGKGGYQSLVDNLLKPLPARSQRKISGTSLLTSSDIGEIGRIGQPDQIGENLEKETHEPKLGASGEVEQQAEPVESHETPKSTSYSPIPPRQLEFTDWEKADIQRLWLMFRTPRTIKRFINIYRLLRAGLVSEMEVKNFEGTQGKPGEYQVALLLLGLITAYPNEASQLLYRLDSWLDIQEVNKKKRVTNWEELIEFLKQESQVSARQESSTLRVDQTQNVGNEQIAQLNEKAPGIEFVDNDQDSDVSWNLMLDCLSQITQDNVWKRNFKITALRTWVMRVARFSFSVQPT